MTGLHTLSARAVADVLNCNIQTVRRNLAGAPVRRDGDASKLYRLGDVLIGFRRPGRKVERDQLDALVAQDAAKRAEAGLLGRWDIYVGEPDPRLGEALTSAERDRFAVVRRLLRRGALEALWTGAVTIPETVWDTALWHPAIQRHVLGNDSAELPDATGWVRAAAMFALIHAPDPMPATLHFPAPSLNTLKEAA